MRVGHGYDIHRLVEGRPLNLGGIQIASPRGLLGHSDGDVVLHAVCDAILGAIGAGDIGQHFPDADAQLKDVASATLVQRVAHLMREQGYEIGNVDVTIVAEQPRLTPHREAMSACLAALLGVPATHVSIKAKTNEGLDALGRGEAIAATVVALLERAN
jgi:2-C-methyl-D-erythritol 2,4-cyclodiphosphate synthase